MLGLPEESLQEQGMNAYGRQENEPEIVLWEGDINPDGTAGTNYREMALPLTQAEELIREMRKAYPRNDN